MTSRRSCLPTFHLACTVLIFLSLTIDCTSVSSQLARRVSYRYRGYHRPHHPSDTRKKKFKIETEDECRMYLCKYGYLNCNCTQYLNPSSSHDEPEHIRRYKRDFNVIIPTELDNRVFNNAQELVTLPNILTTPSSQTCNANHFRQGYEEFQYIYRLQITRQCDRRTMELMSKTRCGQPDIFDMDEVIAKESAYHREASSQSRQPRSLKTIMFDLKGTTMDILSERRYELLKEYLREQEKLDQQTYNGGTTTRNKRSILDVQVSDYSGFMTKDRISWRLMSSHVSPDLPVTTQNAILMNAFRYWSEVSPLCFEEKKTARSVDIEIGFLEGTHLNCFKRFDGFGGEIAHKFITDVHFDKTEPYTGDVNDENSISLLLVAVHEIGHVLGFNHSATTGSVMNAIYHRNIRGKFELSDHDRAEVKRAYGSCKGKFDLVFDFVKNSPDDGSRIFNTFFFRSDSYWMYENVNQRPRFGDPLNVNKMWRGLPNPANMDAFVHYFEQDSSYPNQLRDEYFFFKGDKYYKYNAVTDSVSERGQIRNKFTNGPRGSIPSNLDTAFYNFLSRDILFFKGDTVWKYPYSFTKSHSCCSEPAKRIVDMFPPRSRSDLTAPNGETYVRDLDAIYFSWTAPFPLYLIKGNSVWKVDGFSIYSQYQESNLRAKYIGPWSDLWHYICDVNCSR